MCRTRFSRHTHVEYARTMRYIRKQPQKGTHALAYLHAYTFTRTHQYPPVLRRFIGYHPSDSDQSHRMFACNDVVNIDRAELSDRSPKYIHHDMRLIVSCLLHVSYSMSDCVARHFYRFGGSCNFVFHGFQHNTSCIECHAF